MTATEIVAMIFARFAARGHQHYGEEVTEQQHALQCAHFAQLEGQPPTLIAACLLHDIGHLLHELGEDIARKGVDAVHEEYGATWLAGYFPPEIVEPVRLHVAAKRYLCAVDTDYQTSLSEASQTSLQLQGGPMSPAEVAAFQANPHYSDAVQLRLYDDAGKVTDLVTPPLESYRALLESLALVA